MYQWGRKDAFPGADGSTITEVADGNNAQTIPIYGADGSTLSEGSTGLRTVAITTNGVLSGNTSQAYAIKNPLAFIYGVSTLYDWYTNSDTYQNNTLWGDGEKSEHDPCPHGWRVLTDGTYGDFSTETFPYYIQGSQISSGNYNETNGRQYNQISWFPAAGYRKAGSGALGTVGNYAYYWSASVSDTGAKGLYITMSSVDPRTNYRGRANGMSIRCVQE